jgi:sulfur carrier protein
VIIELNGAAHEVEHGTTLVELIENVAGSTRGSAAAIDGAVIPRSEWPTYELRAGQSIELITAKQGG